MPSMLYRRATPAIVAKHIHITIGMTDNSSLLPSAAVDALINFDNIQPSTVELEANGLIDDMEFDHSSFLHTMSHEKEDTIQINGISLVLFLLLLIFRC